MFYELRVYRCMPGRKADVLARFRHYTMGFFKKHGIEVIGFWDTVVGDVDELVYILRWASWEDRTKKESAFQADPGWQKAREESHRHGAIVARTRTSLLEATDFSPADPPTTMKL